MLAYGVVQPAMSVEMMPRYPYSRINIVGAPGSGTSTLGRALAARLGHVFTDADDFYWKPTTPPFQQKLAPELRVSSLLDDMAKRHASVVAGSICPAFLAWAGQYDAGTLPGRSRARHEAWLASRTCRVLRFDGDGGVEDRVDEVIAMTAGVPI